MDLDRLLSDRARAVDSSGIRRVFELGAKLADPINLSIGQPDFPVPEAIKRAAIEAVEQDKNGYTLTGGVAPLRERIRQDLREHLAWPDERVGVCVTSGTSGALLLASMTLLSPGDEYIIPDPYFVMYPALGGMLGAKPVLCNTYPDFRMTAERVAPLITKRTKFVLACSPGNPTGVTLSQQECDDLAALCREKGVVLISDEIYDRFVFPTEVGGADAPGRAPSPGFATDRVRDPWEGMLVVRGFGKTYGATGWRMGYVAGNAQIVDHIAKFQQYTFVCAPSMAQWGCLAAFDTDIEPIVRQYAKRRDMVVRRLSEVTEVTVPGGAFYAFVKVPPSLGLTATQFVERAIERRVLIIPGGVFSSRDTHFRLSFAVSDAKLDEGLGILAELMRG